MQPRKLTAGFVVVTMGIATPAAAADTVCRSMDRAYHMMARDVLGALGTHRACIRRSDGRDDCSGEFLFLQAAQHQYEAAMERRRTACLARVP